MKKFFVWIAVFSFSLAAQAADPFHVFTVTDGHQLKARVLSLDMKAGTVDIQRKAGTTVCLNIETLSEGDRAYLEQWVPCALFQSPIDFAIVPRRTIVQNWRVGQGTADQATRTIYDIGMINRSGWPMDNLTLEYLVFYTHEATGAGNDERIVGGTIPVGSIDVGAWKSFSMDSLAIMESSAGAQLKTSLADAAGKQSQIWIRVAMDAPDGTQVERIFSLPYSGAVTHAAWLSRAEMLNTPGSGVSES